MACTVKTHVRDRIPDEVRTNSVKLALEDLAEIHLDKAAFGPNYLMRGGKSKLDMHHSSPRREPHKLHLISKHKSSCGFQFSRRLLKSRNTITSLLAKDGFVARHGLH